MKMLMRWVWVLGFVPLLACGGEAYVCESQGVSARPVDGCLDPFDCDSETCDVAFEGCEDSAAPRVACSGDACTCYDGDEVIGSCAYQTNQCPIAIEVQLDGDPTQAMLFYEDCCGVEIIAD